LAYGIGELAIKSVSRVEATSVTPIFEPNRTSPFDINGPTKHLQNIYKQQGARSVFSLTEPIHLVHQYMWAREVDAVWLSLRKLINVEKFVETSSKDLTGVFMEDDSSALSGEGGRVGQKKNGNL
jgi:hypothetical protein